MKKILIALIVISIAFSSSIVNSEEKSDGIFTDISDDKSAGTTDGGVDYDTIFIFSQNPTRMECIDFIIRNSSIDYTLADVSLLNAYTDSAEITRDTQKQIVSAAIQNGIINGYEDNTLKLSESVTRAEFACMIYRARDFYMPCAELVTYSGDYTDLSDWNRAEIIYCIENGFLMGYGDSFGSDDLIEDWQMNIISNRLRYGLSTREKYSFMNVCGVAPIPYDEILNSAYDAGFASYNPRIEALETDTSIDNATAADKLVSMLDMLGNLDCDKLQNEAYVNYQRADFVRSIPPVGEKVPYSIVINGEYTDIDSVISDAKSNNTKRESIHVLAPQNTYTGRLATAYRIRKGTGYEYFMYTQGDNLPSGAEYGVWYRRKFTAEYEESIRSTHSHIFAVGYGEWERYK